MHEKLLEESNLERCVLKGNVMKYERSLASSNKFIKRYITLTNHFVYYFSSAADSSPILKVPISMLESVDSFPVINSLKQNEAYYNNMFEIKLKP